MNTRPLLSLIVLPAALLLGLRWLDAAQAPSFDRLSDKDRKVFARRFERDVWPLLERGGKESCVGCHKGPLGGAALRLTGDAGKDFRKMLHDGFFLKDDAGSLLSRITDANPKRHMPPGKRPGWAPEQIKVLSDFVRDLDRKQLP